MNSFYCKAFGSCWVHIGFIQLDTGIWFIFPETKKFLGDKKLHGAQENFISR